MNIPNKKYITIGTRGSQLALKQADMTISALEFAHPHLTGQIKIKAITTSGDKFQEASLSKIGGKGLFIKEIEEELLNGGVDIAVHSMKDMPAYETENLNINAMLPRANPADCLISIKYKSLKEIPVGAKIGTSSIRRKILILAERPDLEVIELRGNVTTRLTKLQNGDYDAIILAVAGLDRLNLNENIVEVFNTTTFIPAIAQGAIGLQIRSDDSETAEFLTPLNCNNTFNAVSAEREIMKAIGGDCTTPAAGHAIIKGNNIEIYGMLASYDGTNIKTTSRFGFVQEALELGAEIGSELKCMVPQ